MDWDNKGSGDAQSGGAQPQEMRYDVFISYSSEDARLYGEEIIHSIKREIEADLFDITCRRLVFLDTEALKYGDEWQAKIIEKLNKCRVFVCLLSENYFKSSYCTRERLWWETIEIRRGRLRQTTLPVYYIPLKCSPFKDDRPSVQDLFGFQMERVEGKLMPWFDHGKEAVKELYLKERIDKLKCAVREKVSLAEAAEGFNTVFPEQSPNFVGRILDLKMLREICAGKRYPVIEGKPGVGKTELATVYSYGYAEEYPQGRFLVHMEGKHSWEEAVLSLVNDPDTGRMVQTELGISDDEMRNCTADPSPEKRRNLHRLIIERLFARAKDKRLLLLLDNVDDASLFQERRLQDFSLKRPIPDNIHMVATTRYQLEFPNERCHAKVLSVDDLDDDAAFELFCIIGQNRFPFCKKPELDRDDPEYKAAMEIIHQVKGHVWALEIIAGQIANEYDDGATFQKRIASLRESFSIEGKNDSWRSPADSPGDLVRDTLNILKKLENGDVIVRLAYFAALLAPDGKKKDVLRTCWDKIFADVRFKNKDIDPFLFAFNHLWRYNLLHSKDDDKMHRLTQTGLKQIMKEGGILEECVGRLADIMVNTPLTGFETWLSTLSNTPEIAVYLKETHEKFFFELLSPAAWVTLLSFDPLQPILVEMCPWDNLNGWNWADLLKKRPQFAGKCDWDKLSGLDWAELVSEQVHFKDRCPWSIFDGGDWAILLAKQPQFAGKCKWDTLGVMEWFSLLQMQPKFEDKCPWNLLFDVARLDDDYCLEWISLLQAQPKFEDKCPWDRLSGIHWAYLLSEQPGFKTRCPWSKLNGHDWAYLLSEQPGFKTRCPWNKLNGRDWVELLSKQPQFDSKCKWDKLDSHDRAALLVKQPSFTDRVQWDALTGWDWSVLLQIQPQFKDKCPWDSLDGTEWVYLLEDQPQFAIHCRWDKLNGPDWAELLLEDPQYADHCNWEKLYGCDWCLLLMIQPQFAVYCRWNRLNGYDWTDLLQSQPQFADRCDKWDKLDKENWLSLLYYQPQFAGKCPFNELKR